MVSLLEAYLDAVRSTFRPPVNKTYWRRIALGTWVVGLGFLLTAIRFALDPDPKSAGFAGLLLVYFVAQAAFLVSGTRRLLAAEPEPSQEHPGAT